MDSREQQESFADRARREFREQIPWWREEKPLKPLPAKPEEMLEQGDEAFVEEMLKFGALSLGDYSISLRENGKWVRIRPEDYKEDIDRSDGSWLWTLYLKRHPLAQRALIELLSLRDYWETNRMVHQWFSTSRYGGWWEGKWQSQMYWGTWHRSTFIPLTDRFFRYLKAMFKAAEEKAEDAGVWAVLAYRFDVERRFGSYMQIGKDEYQRIYSADTHHYLRRRGWRTLKKLGESGSPEYVRRAAELLKWYSDEDARGGWRMQYEYADPSCLDFTRLWIFNQILFRNSNRFVPASPRRFRAVEGSSLRDWPEVREEAFPELWDERPDLLWQLVKEARATPVIRFAGRALRMANREFLEGIPKEDLSRMLRDSHPARRVVAAEALLERLDPRQPKLKAWLELIRINDPGVQESAKVFVRKHAGSWEPGFKLNWLEILLRMIRHEGQYRHVVESLTEVIREAFADILPRMASAGLAAELAGSPHQAVRELAALVLEKTDPALHPYTGRDLLPFLSGEDPVVRQAARNIFEKRFAELELDAAVLAELASIPGEDHQPFVTRFFADRVLWLVPHLPELIRLLWARMLNPDLPEEVRAFVREELLGRLFFEELADTPLEKVFRLLEHHETGLSEFGTRLFLRINPRTEDLLPDELIRMAHNPVALAREEARKRIAESLHRFGEEELVRLAETQWEDTRNWTLDVIRSLPPERITPELVYGLMDTSREDIQRFAMELVRSRQEELDLLELMLRASEHPDLTVQEYALRIAGQLAWRAELVKKLELFFRTVLFRVHAGRKAKDLALDLLLRLAELSRETAEAVAPLLADVSRTQTRKDFDRVLTALVRIRDRFPGISLPVKPI
jgi:hypothetical protein